MSLAFDNLFGKSLKIIEASSPSSKSNRFWTLNATILLLSCLNMSLVAVSRTNEALDQTPIRLCKFVEIGKFREVSYGACCFSENSHACFLQWGYMRQSITVVSFGF